MIEFMRLNRCSEKVWINQIERDNKNNELSFDVFRLLIIIFYMSEKD